LPEERLIAEFNDDSMLELTPVLVGPSVTKTTASAWNYPTAMVPKSAATSPISSCASTMVTAMATC
jgi:hypothetical protein